MQKIILLLIVPFVLILAAALLPRTSCFVNWLDSDLHRLDGPFSQCPKQLDERRIGLSNFARIGANVYRVGRDESVQPAGFPCLIGVACLPIPSGRRTWKKIELIRLDGPVVFERLKAYMDGEYMSDGNAMFNDYKRVDATDFPIDPTRLRRFPCFQSDPGVPCKAYITDGRYVFRGKAVVYGADPTSFSDDLGSLDTEGYHLQSTAFTRDRTSVFAYGKRINGADPATFGVLRKPNEIIGFDKQHAWRDRSDEVEPLDLTSDQLQKLRAELESARAARKARSAISEDGRTSGPCALNLELQQSNGSPCVQRTGDQRTVAGRPSISIGR